MGGVAGDEDMPTAIVIDDAVMERAGNLSVVAYDAGWNDLGGWDAVAREMGADAAGVSIAGAVTAIDCAQTLLRSDSEGVELVGIGLSLWDKRSRR